jgi:hypothetical protein
MRRYEHCAHSAPAATFATFVLVLGRHHELHHSPAKELRQAKQAQRRAAHLSKKAARSSSPEARAAAIAARAVARVEAKQAAKVRHATQAQLLAVVQAERTRLKSVWTAAKVELQNARAHAKECAAPKDSDPEVPTPDES